MACVVLCCVVLPAAVDSIIIWMTLYVTTNIHAPSSFLPNIINIYFQGLSPSVIALYFAEERRLRGGPYKING
jgi:hypothetical protein